MNSVYQMKLRNLYLKKQIKSGKKKKIKRQYQKFQEDVLKIKLRKTKWNPRYSKGFFP